MEVRVMLKQEVKSQETNSESDPGMGPKRLWLQRSPLPTPHPTCSADLWTLTCARARSAAIQVRAARSTGGKNLTCVENEKHARPYIFCKRACCFNTYTVGLWRPLWSLAVGDGLCPAANDDAAPIEEDCGGGGGGGGNVSWNKQANNTDKFSRIIMLRS